MARAAPKLRTCLLFSTDLSSRCDRALDRAIQLSTQLDATLVALHVLENDLLPEPELSREIETRRVETEAMITASAGRKAIDLSVEVVPGRAAKLVVETARANRCRLIVMSPARDDTLGSAILGSTVDRVLRHADQPVLIVKKRCRGPYRSILVAVDLSEPSAEALKFVKAMFPLARLTVIHAGSAPLPAFLGAMGEAKALRAERMEAVKALIDDALGHGASKRVDIVVEEGGPEDVVSEQLAVKPADLVVVGTHGTSGIRRAVIGSTAERLIQVLPADILAVRPKSAD